MMKLPAFYRLFFVFILVSFACNINNPRGLPSETSNETPTPNSLATAFAIVTITAAAEIQPTEPVLATSTVPFIGTGTPLIPITGATQKPVNTPAANLSPWPVLQAGSEGPEVYAVQSLLRYHGHSLDINSTFDEQTGDAVVKFQTQTGLPATGIVEQETYLALIRIGAVQKGQTGYAVQAVQHLLSMKFGYSISVNGTFDSATDSAVRDLQDYLNLVVDGLVGPQTWQALFSPVP